MSILNLYVPAAVFGGLIAGYFSDWHIGRFQTSRKPIIHVCTLGVGLGCFLLSELAMQHPLSWSVY